ncbi:hypothetical protein FGG08_000528 [Glutinoglossum americanum]|uniref:NACHT domain-containing protein n=1 Tax=Glutinoglossum americanum TaxID=1670608 RepID=A0A9P8IA26_9PEZI|nr:hypothetical protein FGG08_000528 [Glutinoglossum americanum]
MLGIIAVHGLGADPGATWMAQDDKDAEPTDKSTADGVTWLSHQEMMPAFVPNARALASAGTVNSISQYILHATAGVIFLSTPLRGSNPASWARMIANSAKVLGFQSSDYLMKDFTASPKVLADLLYDFRVTINQPLLQLTVIVDEASACIDGHRKIPLSTSHTKMNKFGQPDDKNFQLLAGCIRELASRAPGVLQARYYAPVDAPFRECVAALFQTDPRDNYMQTQETGNRRADGTCEWVLQEESYAGWLLSKQTAILWIGGAPAMGKTMVASFLVNEMGIRARQETDMTLAYYFCDASDERRNTAESVLRSLLMQILQQRPELFRHLKSEFDIQKTVLFTSGGAIHTLWRILRDILDDPESKDVYIIIDALNECKVESRQAFIDHLGDLASPSLRPESSTEDTEPPRTKVLITSRPLHGVEERFSGKNARFLRLDVDIISADIEKYIQAKVGLLDAKFYPPTRQGQIHEYLKHNAKGSFLWASLVLNELSKGTLLEPDVELSQIPATLSELYARFIHRIDGRHTDTVREILLWVATAARPLTTRELADAIMLSRQASVPSPPEEQALKNLAVTLDLCRPLVQIREKTQTVHFIHKTVKDYLIATNIVPPTPRANFAAFLGCSQYLSARLGAELSGEGTSPDQDPFLGYACANWPWHAQLSGNVTLTITDWVPGWFLMDPAKREALSNLPYPSLHDDTTLPRTPTLLQLTAYLGLAYILMAIDEQGLLDHEISTRDGQGRIPLHWAAEMGHDETVKLLLQMGSNANAQDNMGDSPLHIAILHSHEKVAEVLLDGGANPTLPGRNQKPPLHLAAEVGGKRIIKTLLSHHANPNSELPDKTTPLHLAAQWGHTSAIIQLLSAGANINAFKPFGESALHSAVRNGHEEAMLSLLERGANVNALTSDKTSPEDLVPREGKMHYQSYTSTASWTPLHIAAIKGYRQICEILLLYGADPASQTLKGKTPLQVAVDQHEEGIAELLIEVDSSLAANDILQATIQCRSYRLVRSFFADPSDRLDIGAALRLSAESGDPTLVEITCEKFTSDQIKKGAFAACSAALTLNRPDILETLIHKGADIQAIGPWRKTLLHLAVGADNLTLATLLITHGVNVSAQDGSKYTPLHIAVERDNKDMVSLLLRSGTQVDLADVERCTPLHFAAHAGAGDIVAMLVDEGGADMSLKDADGRTALDLAITKGYAGIQGFLEDRRESEWMTDDSDKLEPIREDELSPGPKRNRRVTASGQRVMSGPRSSRTKLRRNGR